MTDQPDTSNNLVIRGADGDPVPTGTRMIEKESYERVVEGLKIMADAAAHLVRLEPSSAHIWRGVHQRLDTTRRAAVQYAGLTEPMQQQETEAKRNGDTMPWVEARKRFREGGKQAAGGMRQLATCHRSDFAWSRMAGEIEDMVRKLSEGARKKLRPPSLWVPPSYH